MMPGRPPVEDAIPPIPQYGIRPRDPNRADYRFQPTYLDDILWNAYGGRMTATPQGQQDLLATSSNEIQDVRAGGQTRSTLPADYYSRSNRLARSQTPQAQAVVAALDRLAANPYGRRLATHMPEQAGVIAASGAAGRAAQPRYRPPIGELVGKRPTGGVEFGRSTTNPNRMVWRNARGQAIATARSEDAGFRLLGQSRRGRRGMNVAV